MTVEFRDRNVMRKLAESDFSGLVEEKSRLGRVIIESNSDIEYHQLLSFAIKEDR